MRGDAGFDVEPSNRDSCLNTLALEFFFGHYLHDIILKLFISLCGNTFFLKNSFDCNEFKKTKINI